MLSNLGYLVLDPRDILSNLGGRLSDLGASRIFFQKSAPLTRPQKLGASVIFKQFFMFSLVVTNASVSLKKLAPRLDRRASIGIFSPL